MNHHKFIHAFTICVLARITLASSTLVIAVPSAPSAQTCAAFPKFLHEVVGLQPASRIIVFDAPNKQRLAECEIPKISGNGRLRHISKALAPVFEHLKPKEGAVDELDVPAFMPTVSAILKNSDGPVRLVLLGSVYHLEDQDNVAQFGPGQILSADHVLASPKESPWGTSESPKALDRLIVDFLIVDKSTARQRTYVSEFYASYFRLQGAILSSFMDSPKDVAERIVAGKGEPVTLRSPQPTGKLEVLEIPEIPIATPKPMEPAKRASTDRPEAEAATASQPSAKRLRTESGSDTFTTPANLQKEIDVPVALVLVIDQSSSNAASLQLIATRTAPEVATLAPSLMPNFSMGLCLHSSESAAISWGPKVIEKSGLSSPSMGYKSLMSFIAPTNGVSPFRPVKGFVNSERAITSGLRMLERSPNSRRVLLIMGDTSFAESDGKYGMSEADKLSETRTLQAVAEYVKSGDCRIVTVYTGATGGSTVTSEAAQTIEAFRNISNLAGSRGIFHSGLDGMDEVIRRALLNP